VVELKWPHASARVSAISVAIVVAAWLSMLVGVILDQDPKVMHGRAIDYSPAQEELSRIFAATWIILGAIAFIPACIALYLATSRSERRVAIISAAACAAMPIFLYLLAASGYFSDYGS
jgi:hypothetical protein